MKIFLPDGKLNRCGERVREARLRAELTQEELAARLQVTGLPLSQLAVSRIEIGKRIVPDFELPYLAEALNVTTAWLLDKD
ncbi:MAG: helix-turn-helix transcriptional regulator [Ruminococcaceae bacterium]|nr:helix-turn-helix transcriptional regulator [Oscillospiraceae bacterium]MBE7008226.1 helix-turn-helix transcriptional regulator [Oscillospiraceae bacterium]